MPPKNISTPHTSRLTGFTANSLWHQRMARIQSGTTSKVQPRLAAELILHPVISQRLPVTPIRPSQPRDSLDACHAA